MLALLGRGLVSAAGVGVAALRTALDAGTSHVGPLPEAIARGLAVRRGALIEGAIADAAAAAVAEALAEASLPREARVGLALGTALGDGGPSLSALTDRLADGLDGPRSTHSATCASGLYALEHAALDLARGRADAMVVVALDQLDRRMQGGFSVLGALSPTDPGDALPTDGILLGEAACALVVGPGGSAGRARIAGRGLTADGTHLTSPDTSGAGMARAIRRALDDAGARPADVARVSWTAAGAPAYRALYAGALEAVFGDAPPPIATWEVAIGHALAATGPLGILHASLLLDAGCDGDVLALTVGFGGQNGATLVRC